jgi:hypothetical protein
MTDEFDMPLGLMDTDEFGEDAEVPLRLPATKSTYHTRDLTKKTSRAHSALEKAFHSLWALLNCLSTLRTPGRAPLEPVPSGRSKA